MWAMNTPDRIAAEAQGHVEPTDAGDGAACQVAVVVPEDIDQRVEAVLMTTDGPQPAAKVAQLVGVGVKVVQETVHWLNQRYDETGRSFRIESVARGWQIMTLPKFAELLDQAHKGKAATRLSPAALETLAIIAYKQPILRADVESIRGVASGEVIRGLMERRLVTIAGRAQELGRPMLYGTTRSFLEVFGLACLKDLPKVDELWQKE
jgi:segregation and condensation protein B